MQRNTDAVWRASRVGILSMELLLTLPVLMILLLGAVELAWLYRGYGVVQKASMAGAQAAEVTGADHQSIRAAVRHALGAELQPSADIEIRRQEFTGNVLSCGIRIPMEACAPNLLWPVGFDIGGESIECVTAVGNE
jgi:TadE-like protein